jgi:hypothetical protein
MKTIIGVMGPSHEATESDESLAYEVGRLIAENGWVLLSGGVHIGVMKAVHAGNKEAGGLSIGIIPRQDSEIADGADIAIRTDMGSGRNNINVLSSNVVIAIGNSPGTSSEISLALQPRAGKHVILLGASHESIAYFSSLVPERVHAAESGEEAINLVKGLIDNSAAVN